MFGMFNAACFAEILITFNVTYDSLTVWKLACWLTELRKVNTNLLPFFVSVVFLHVARKTLGSGLNDELMDVLAVLVGLSIGPRRYSSRRSSVLLISEAVNLMKAVDDRHKSRSTVQLIEIELSKAYLYLSLIHI